MSPEWTELECGGVRLAVRGTSGAMVERLPGTRLVELPGAAHDLHLDRPADWRAALTAFLENTA